jgi:hypothetical protein
MMDCESWGVNVKEGNQELDVGVDSISGSYQVNMIAKPMAVADLPKPVIETFKTKYPQATLKSAREVLRGLMALPPGKTKPPDYELSIVTADNQSLLVCFTPELKTDSQGNTVPNSEKMVFSWESPSKNGPQ